MVAPRPDGKGRRPARIPDLEEILEVDTPNETWTKEVLNSARAVLPEGAEIRDINVRCVQTFCRIRLVKPLLTLDGWPEIDRVLSPIAEGELFFLTENDGATSTGYMYFSAEDSELPLGQGVREDET